MSLFTDASLVLVPSGIKNQKVYSIVPTDGSGDLTFSRASDATRVNSSGLVEKVRTNSILYSNTFNGVNWSSDGTLTSGQSGYDGTANAWKIESSASAQETRVRQNNPFASGQLMTISVYMKAGTVNYGIVRTYAITGGGRVWFNLSSGTVGTQNTGLTGSIASVGGGWYRCSITGTLNTSGAIDISPATADNVYLSTASGEGIFIQNSQLETGDIATDPITTLGSAVSVGPVSGLPRLNYSGGASCPSLLLEPQRTNSLTFSEQIDNAAWATDGNGAGETKTANYAISPDGYQDADRIQLNRTGGTYSRVRQDYVAAGAHTGSIYLKSNTGASQKIWMRVDGTTATKITITTSWQRFVVSQGSSAALELFIDNTDAEIATIADFSAWGAQVEAGAYATSYIGPTYSSAVTRVADAASKTGIASLIGQSEGTIYWEGIAPPSDTIIVQLEKSSPLCIARFLQSSGVITAQLYIDATAFNFSANFTPVVGTTIKLAFAYKSGSLAFYANGVQIGVSSSIFSGLSLDTLRLANDFGTPSVSLNENKQALLFTQRLPNSDLATLTA